MTTPCPPKGRLRFDQHFKIEKFFDWKCSLSPLAGEAVQSKENFKLGWIQDE